MPADVNVTEKVARALNPSAFDPKAWPPVTFGQSVDEARAEWRQEAFEEAQRALAVLADPEVQAGMAGVLRKHGVVTVRQGNTSRGGLIHNERACEGCGHELPWHSWRDELADHAAAEVVEWLRGRAL